MTGLKQFILDAFYGRNRGLYALRLPKPFVRYRCSLCNAWVSQDAMVCPSCGAILREVDWD